MVGALPVWTTTRSIIDYCWRERTFALRYATIPVLVVIAVDLGGMVAHIDIVRNVYWQFFTGILSLLAYTPFMVTWYRRVVAGDGPAETRPLFTFSALEWRVVTLNVLVGVILAVALLLMAGVLAIIGYGIARYLPAYGTGPIAIMILAIPALFFWLVLFTRLSLVIAYAAMGEHLKLRAAWTMTRAVGVSMTWIHILLGLAAFVPVALVGAGITLVATDSPALTAIVTSLIGTIGGLLYLTLFTTLYGVVYRKLNGRETF